jgi:polysaccharide biosynthesis transport protein
MTFEQLLAVLRARWLIASAVFLLVVSSAMLITLLMPKTYTAYTSVVLDAKPDPFMGAMVAASPSYLLTQVDVISSRRVADKVVEDLKLTSIPDLRQRWLNTTGGVGDFKSWVADVIRGGIEARPSRGSNTIRITYEASDPVFAATVANAFVRAYLLVNTEMRNEPAKQFSSLFESNGKVLRERLESAQNRLSEFQQKNGLIISDERLDIETSRLSELSQQLVIAQSAVADSGSRKVAANSQGERSQDVMGSPLVASLKSELLKQESMLVQLRSRYGDQHPLVQEALSGVATLRAKFDTELRRTAASLGVNNDVNLSRASQISAALDQQRSKVLKLKATRDEAALLIKDVESARAAYESVLSRLNMTTLESQSNVPNVMLLEQAAPPPNASSPRIRVNLAVGFVAGFMLALVITLLVERFDRRLRTLADVENTLGLSLISCVPTFKNVNRTAAAMPDRLGLSVATRPPSLGR